MRTLARLLCLLLVPVAAQAQSTQDTWSVSLVEGSVVMGEASTLTFEATNGTTSARPINEVVFAFPAGYTLLGGEGPQRWVVWKIDAANRSIAFWLDGNNCGVPRPGLTPGTSARFKVRVVAPPANTDTTDALVGGVTIPYKTTQAWETCQGRYFSGDPTAVSWQRRSLSAQLEALPRTLRPGESTTAQLTVTNRSLQEQDGLKLSGPRAVGSATFELVGGSTPSELRLGPGQSGVFTATLRSTSSGSAVLQASAGNAASAPASSPVVSSLQVDVSNFAALGELFPIDVISGETAQVVLTVSNPSTTTYLNVRPREPVFQGSATVALVSGPTPASLTSLAPGASASFAWEYRVTGAVGSTFQFQLQGEATVSGASLATSLVSTAQGYIPEHKVRISPLSLRGGSSSQTVGYTVFNGGSVAIRSVKLRTPDAALFLVSPTPFASDASGWRTSIDTGSTPGYVWTAPSVSAYLQPGQQLTLSLDYASISPVTRDTISNQSMELRQGPWLKVPILNVPVTVVVPRPVPEVQDVVALAGPGRNTLLWTNPPVHDGVLVLRSTGTAPEQAPAHGKRYAVGEAIGNATVLYWDERSVVSSFADTGLLNGTAYYYRVFNHDELYQYSPGNVPSSSGLKSIPTGRGPGEPLWCYSVGMPTLLQPVTELGVGIFSANNAGTVTANLTHTDDPLLDGGERWRPARLQGPVQSRFPIVPLHGMPGQYIFTGDQAGYTYAIRAETGQLLWRGNGGQSLGIIQSFPVTQLYDYANAAYRSAHPQRDLVFFATRLSTGTDNKVVALNARTGERVWTYAPGDLGMVSGGMLIDYANNRLYVGARSNGGILDSLRVLDSLSGSERARLRLGDIDHSIVRSGSQAYVTSSDGTVYGVDLASMNVAWSAPVASQPSPGVPAFTSFVRPVVGGFLASIQGATASEGRVERWSVSGTTVTRLWSTPIPGPSGTFSITLDNLTRVYVGGADERLHELELGTGVDRRQVALPGALAIGTPTVDTRVGRLHVGTQDGRLCAFPVPFL